MKKHSGMRPQDVVILLKIISLAEQPFLLKDLSYQLSISSSEVSESINRSVIAGLIADDKKTIMKKVFYDFLIYGLPFVFPQHPGPMVPGIPTAHSAPPLNKEFKNSELFVWQDAKEGKVRGQKIEPLHHGQIKAAKEDKNLYELLALVDVLRVGRLREKKMAETELKKRILG